MTSENSAPDKQIIPSLLHPLGPPSFTPGSRGEMRRLSGEGLTTRTNAPACCRPESRNVCKPRELRGTQSVGLSSSAGLTGVGGGRGDGGGGTPLSPLTNPSLFDGERRQFRFNYPSPCQRLAEYRGDADFGLTGFYVTGARETHNVSAVLLPVQLAGSFAGVWSPSP